MHCNEEVDDAIKIRKRAWNVFHASRTTEHKEKLAEQRHETDCVICKANKNAWKDTDGRISETEGQKLLWTILKGINRQARPFTPKTAQNRPSLRQKESETFLAVPHFFHKTLE